MYRVMGPDGSDQLAKVMTFFNARGRGKPPALTTDLFGTAHLSSLELASFLSHIESQFGIEITEAEVTPENFGTIEKTLAFVELRLRGN